MSRRNKLGQAKSDYERERRRLVDEIGDPVAGFLRDELCEFWRPTNDWEGPAPYSGEFLGVGPTWEDAASAALRSMAPIMAVVDRIERKTR